MIIHDYLIVPASEITESRFHRLSTNGWILTRLHGCQLVFRRFNWEVIKRDVALILAGTLKL